MALKANDFLTGSSSVRHEVETEKGVLVVFVKPLTWIQQQEAISQFVDFQITDGDPTPSIDFGGFYSYVLTNCVERTEPSISRKDILKLSPEVGREIMKVLPSIETLMESFGGGESAPLG